MILVRKRINGSIRNGEGFYLSPFLFTYPCIDGYLHIKKQELKVTQSLLGLQLFIMCATQIVIIL